MEAGTATVGCVLFSSSEGGGRSWPAGLPFRIILPASSARPAWRRHRQVVSRSNTAKLSGLWDFAFPSWDFALPLRDFTFPARDFSFPAGEFTFPVRDFAFPMRDFAVPTWDLAFPAQDSLFPRGSSLFPLWILPSLRRISLFL